MSANKAGANAARVKSKRSGNEEQAQQERRVSAVGAKGKRGGGKTLVQRDREASAGARYSEDFRGLPREILKTLGGHRAQF